MWHCEGLFADGLSDNDKKMASSKKHKLKIFIYHPACQPSQAIICTTADQPHLKRQGCV